MFYMMIVAIKIRYPETPFVHNAQTHNILMMALNGLFPT